MSEKWIGKHIVMSKEDAIYTDDGDKYLDLLDVDVTGGGSEVDESTHPILHGIMATLPTMASPDPDTPYKIVADKT